MEIKINVNNVFKVIHWIILFRNVLGIRVRRIVFIVWSLLFVLFVIRDLILIVTFFVRVLSWFLGIFVLNLNAHSVLIILSVGHACLDISPMLRVYAKYRIVRLQTARFVFLLLRLTCVWYASKVFILTHISNVCLTSQPSWLRLAQFLIVSIASKIINVQSVSQATKYKKGCVYWNQGVRILTVIFVYLPLCVLFVKTDSQYPKGVVPTFL